MVSLHSSPSKGFSVIDVTRLSLQEVRVEMKPNVWMVYTELKRVETVTGRSWKHLLYLGYRVFGNDLFDVMDSSRKN